MIFAKVDLCQGPGVHVHKIFVHFGIFKSDREKYLIVTWRELFSSITVYNVQIIGIMHKCRGKNDFGHHKTQTNSKGCNCRNKCALNTLLHFYQMKMSNLCQNFKIGAAFEKMKRASRKKYFQRKIGRSPWHLAVHRNWCDLESPENWQNGIFHKISSVAGKNELKLPCNGFSSLKHVWWHKSPLFRACMTKY